MFEALGGGAPERPPRPLRVHACASLLAQALDDGRAAASSSHSVDCGHAPDPLPVAAQVANGRKALAEERRETAQDAGHDAPLAVGVEVDLALEPAIEPPRIREPTLHRVA